MSDTTSERWERVKRICAEAGALSTERRAAFLEEVCRDDDAVRAEVESLLGFEKHATGFLEQPASAPEDDRLVGTHVGPYRLVEMIGAGGMGRVYAADRDDDEFEQRVAVKVLKRGLDTDDLLERFRTERQVLAGLHHPNIARLLDGGATDDGLPYLVMELIDGVAIDDYCDRSKLTVARRLDLFRLVCDAVQYAHQQLIVHRDLKPSNIVVTPDGTVKLLDFGIAKVLTPEGTPGTVDVTVTQLRLMTPRYASPEQVRGTRVGTATDVYSLGVILYELLTGQGPYRMETTSRSEIERAICEDQPTRPSSTVSRLTAPGDKAGPATEAISAARGVEPKQLQRQLTGDLDSIMLMAVRKEPERRYASAQQLSEDIRRHLEGLPVLARPDTVRYRATKFVRRNRRLMTGVAILVMLVIGWLVTSSYLFLDATKAREAAAARADEAEWESYVANIAAAESAIRANRLTDARRRLDLTPEHLREWEWRHLLHRLDRSRLVLVSPTGHSGSLAFKPGGRLVAGCPNAAASPIEFFVTTWELATGTVTHTVRMDVEGTGIHQVSANGDRFAWSPRSGEQHDLRVCDAASGQVVLDLEGHTRNVESIAFGPHGALIAAGAYNGVTIIWDARTGAVLHRLQSPDAASGKLDRITGLAFSPDSRLLATGGWAGNVRTWDTETGAVVATCVGGGGAAACVAFSPDGRVLASGSHARVVRLWDPRSGVERLALYGHESNIESIRWSPSGEEVISCSWDETIRRWAARTGRPLAVLRGHTKRVNHVRISEDGALIASAASDGTIRLWGAEDEDVAAWRDHTTWAERVAISPDSTLVASGSLDSTIHIRHLHTGELVTSISQPRGGVFGLSFSGDGRLLASTGHDHRIRLWNVGTWNERGALSGHRGRIQSVRFGPKHNRLVSASHDQTACVWNVDSGESMLVLEGHRGAVLDAAFSPDGALIATGGADGTLRLWDARTGALLSTLAGHRADIRALAFSPGGSRVVTASEDATAMLWDVSGRAHLATLEGHGLAVRSVAFSPDGTRIATGSRDSTIKLWGFGPKDASRQSKPTEVVTLHGHVDWVNSVSFSPDGQWLISCGRDTTTKLWRAVPPPP